MPAHGRRPHSTAQIATYATLPPEQPRPGTATRGTGSQAVTGPPGRPALGTPAATETVPAALVPAFTALSEGHAAAAWGSVVTRLRFHITVPGDRTQALDLRDELVGWLRRRGLDLGLTDDGTDVYLTWPAPRILPEWGPLPDGCTSVFPPRRPGGPPVYGKPTITNLAAGAHLADCDDVSIRFALTDNDHAGTLGIYEGRIGQGDLFAVLHDAGLITRREES